MAKRNRDVHLAPGSLTVGRGAGGSIIKRYFKTWQAD